VPSVEPGHIGREARRRRVHAPALQEVGAIDAGGGDLDGDLAEARLADLDLTDADDLGTTGPAEHHRLGAHHSNQ
jgi:hypothetical protein